MANLADEIDNTLNADTLRSAKQARDKGASSWLNALPIKSQGFHLNKGEFRDALNIRYCRPIRGLPSTCPCGEAFNVRHAMDCKRGGFISTRHNEIRDLEAAMLSEVCKDVSVEPTLQPFTGEYYQHRTANTDDNARLDIKARGFWRRGQTSFFDVRITHINANSNRNSTTDQVLHRSAQEKKRAYNERVMDVENGTFTPLIFGTNGAMGSECKKFHQELANQLSVKRNEPYTKVLNWIRTRLSFSMIRSTLLCLRGTRVPFYNAHLADNFTVAIAEANLFKY